MGGPGPQTTAGQPLAASDKELVDELRSRFASYPIPRDYDTDFNLYRSVPTPTGSTAAVSYSCLDPDRSVESAQLGSRWLAFAGRSSSRPSRTALLGSAEKALRHHLRYRKALRLDSEPVPDYEENPLHQGRLLPQGAFQGMDSSNRLLWICEYRTLGMEGLMNRQRSSEMLYYHFWLYELFRKAVNAQEAATGRMSGLRAIMDLDGYPMSPWAMLFVSSGSMGYYTQLFHVEHYPLIIHVADLVNTAKWLAFPYRVIRAVMPAGFTEQFRVHDSNFDLTRDRDILPQNLPSFLGGTASGMRTVPARTITKEEYWKPSPGDPDPAALLSFSVTPRKQKIIPVQVRFPNTTLSWYFTTDGDLLFGVFRGSPTSDGPQGLDQMDMVEALFRLAGKLVPESGSVVCDRPGTYFLVFCNKASWLTRKTVRIAFDLGELHHTAKNPLDRALSVG